MTFVCVFFLDNEFTTDLGLLLSNVVTMAYNGPSLSLFLANIVRVGDLYII